MKTRDMSTSAIEVRPRNVDWSEIDFIESGEGRTRGNFYEAIECHACGKTTVRAPCESECPKCRAEGDGPEGPMMNYWYPLGFECGDSQAHDMAWKIRHLPLCMVQVGDEWGMALTGGGMDLSWEICEAYMRLGMLPPVHFELPSMCGRGASKRDRWIARR
jgi:hypothetical protein